MVANPTTRDARPEQERLVEAYLDENPNSTVVQIREGIERETEIRIERVQARIDRIAKRRALTKGTGDYGRTTYALGGPTRKLKALGIEARILIVDGAVTLDVREQATDLDDEALVAFLTAVVDAVRRCLTAKGLPLVERLAADLGLLGTSQGEPDWLTTLGAYQDEE